MLSPYFIVDEDVIKGGNNNKLSAVQQINTILGYDPHKGGECSPHIKHNNGVCSTQESIKKMRNWLELCDLKDNKSIIDAAITKTNCNSESCLYSKLDLPKNELNERFNSTGPYNNTDWLNNSNIDDHLKRFAIKFNDFHHINFQMMDFKKMNTELNQVDWQQLVKDGIKSLGCIVNTDYSTGRGQHWVAIFIDFINCTVEYFDSAGQNPMHEILEFQLDTVNKLSTITGKKWKDICVTKLQHQKGNTECGVYSMFYIISRLHDIPYRFFEHTRIPDEDMILFRKSIFRHSS
jgi:hypothetical protein